MLKGILGQPPEQVALLADRCRPTECRPIAACVRHMNENTQLRDASASPNAMDLRLFA